MSSQANSENPLSPSLCSEYELLAFYRSEIRFETETVGARLNALLSSQSFLVIAYATSVNIGGQPQALFGLRLLPHILCVLGFAITLMAAPGIRAAYRVIAKWESKQRALHERHGHLATHTLTTTVDETLESGRLVRQGSFFARHVPALFLFAWIVLFVLATAIFVG